jgi:anaerobic selenocysteine-containing dehydrogenase
MPGVALPDYVHARLIVLWGVNPSISGIHLVPVIHEAQRRGARLVVIDPRRTPLAKRADLHLAPRPGTDLVLALAVIHWLFDNGRADLAFLDAHTHGGAELRRRAAAWDVERAAAVSGLAAADIERFARLYADSSPAVVRTGWGFERNRNGGSAVAAALALPAVGGKFGVRGGGYTLSNSSVWRADHAAATALDALPAVRTVNMNLLGETLLTGAPAVRLLFVYNCNPLATMPDQRRVRRGLEREDLFTVVFDAVRTDTARYADLLLPATTFLEHEELVRGYGALIVHRVRPVIEPVGESRPNYLVFADLCRRLGLARPGDPEGAAGLATALLSGASGAGGGPDPTEGGLDAAGEPAMAAMAARAAPGEVARMRDELDGSGIAAPPCGPNPVQFVDSFPQTADRRADLVPAALDREAPDGLYAYRELPPDASHPLALISPATGRTISSTLGELTRRLVGLELHPEDAARRGLASGDPVRVWNDLGEVRTTLVINADLAPGVAFLPKGLWSHNTRSGTTANALAPATLADLGGGACFNDARVEVERDRDVGAAAAPLGVVPSGAAPSGC